MKQSFKTRLSATVTMASLVAGLFSGTVFADNFETNYNLWVDGVRVTSANKDDVLDDNKVSYDAENNVLTFDDATLTKQSGSAFIYAVMSDELTITGKITVKGALSENISAGIYNGGSITLSDADIDFSGVSYGVFSYSDINVIDSKICLSDNNYCGIASNGILTISGKDAQIDISKCKNGLVSKSLEIKESAKVSVSAYDVCCMGSSFTLNNSSFTASDAAYGIQANTVLVSGKDSVLDINAWAKGIKGETVTISAGKTTIDATLEAKGESNNDFPLAGIHATKSLFISYPDTVVEAKGKDVGLAADEYLKIENSKVKASGTKYAIASDADLYIIGNKTEVIADSEKITDDLGSAILGSDCLTIQGDLEIKSPENGSVLKTESLYYIVEGDGKTPAIHVVVNAHKLTFVPATEPTLDKPGNKEHYKCDDCDDIFADPAGEKRIDKDSVVIPKLTPTATPAPTSTPVATATPIATPTSVPVPTTAKPTATPTPTTAPADSKAQIMDFVKRIYIYVLDREPEEEGAAFWSDELWNFRRTGAEVAQGFIFSPEFEARNTTDEQFVEILYKTFFGRDPEDEGMAFWLNQLKTGAMDRVTVANGFIYSQEWADTCASYGIRSGGDLKPTGAIAPTELTYAFVERMYTTALDRGYDGEGRAYWASALANFEVTGESVGAFFFLSDEMVGYNLSNKDYLDRLYKTFMDREPDEKGAAYWISVLESGTSRTDVVLGFTRSPEFTQKCVEARILPY